MTREKQVKEGVKRMQILKMLEQPIEEFEKEGKLNKSEYGQGILYWLESEEEEMVKEFEETFGTVVYHVIKNRTELGPMYSFLYVSNYESEWAEERQALKEGEPIVYVVTGDMHDHGAIGVVPMNGGVRRTW